jgi:hypothetical protein
MYRETGRIFRSGLSGFFRLSGYHGMKENNTRNPQNAVKECVDDIKTESGTDCQFCGNADTNNAQGPSRFECPEISDTLDLQDSSQKANMQAKSIA